MEAMGAKSETHIVAVPGYNKGHWVLWWPILWEEIVSAYIRRLEDQR